MILSLYHNRRSTRSPSQALNSWYLASKNQSLLNSDITDSGMKLKRKMKWMSSGRIQRIDKHAYRIWYIHTYTHMHVLLVHMAILVCIKTLLSNSSGSYVLLLFDIYCVCECICVCMWFVKIVACALMTQGDTGWPKSTEIEVSMIYVGSRYI